MLRVILEKMQRDLEQEIRVRTEKVLNTPSLTDTKASVLYWQCGYVCALKEIVARIDTIQKGEDAL
ncbi:MAG: hypothetical protein J6A21_03020 [Lentisphaeria bacterium]|nr:hypothetical protein [Lentisphaeria bacterium]